MLHPLEPRRVGVAALMPPFVQRDRLRACKPLQVKRRQFLEEIVVDLAVEIGREGREGKPVLALGTPGSYGICQTQTQALVQHVDFGLE